MHGFTGFGAAMVIMALLPLLLPMTEVLFLGAFFTLPISILTLVRYRRYFRWRDAWPLVVGAVIATPFGLWLVENLDRTILLHGLGIILIIFPLHELFLAHRLRLHMPAWLGLPIGCVAGILGAAFNIGGPPAILFVYSRPWSREQAVATLQMMFLFNSGLRLILTASTVKDSQEVVWICLLAIAPFVLVGQIGFRLAERIPPKHFKQMVMVALIAMGLKYLLT